MFSWFRRKKNQEKVSEAFMSVNQGLKTLYRDRLLPLEEFYKFHEFYTPRMNDSEFDAKPMILLVGQYSTGKTTFIRYLLEQDFPGMRIGPEPTTDKFIAIMHGEKENVIPGNVLVADSNKPFRPLSKFGNAFLNRFQCSLLKNQVLECLSIIDSPGILSGEKQRIDRGYDFTEVVGWFAERVDRIVLLFDAHKLDISDEFKRTIVAMKDYDEKIRIVLNKADMVDQQQLMRVYGALMWSLGKVISTPEVSRVYISTFWDKPLHHDYYRKLFELEARDLFNDIAILPKNSMVQKLNDLVKRARLANVHAYVISYLRSNMPSYYWFGGSSKKTEMINNLDKIFTQLQQRYLISQGDFPDVQHSRQLLANHDFYKFPLLKPELIESVVRMLSDDVGKLMQMIPVEEEQQLEIHSVKGSVFENYEDGPFFDSYPEFMDCEDSWIVDQERHKYDEVFEKLNPVDGKLNGSKVQQELIKSRLPSPVLARIWKLSDVDKDGMLDIDEFALAMFLMNRKIEGFDLPRELPDMRIPPSKQAIQKN